MQRKNCPPFDYSWGSHTHHDKGQRNPLGTSPEKIDKELVIKSCWHYKRFQAQAYQTPPPCDLPLMRTQGVTPYQTIGVDFVGPIKYRLTPKTEGKAYLVLNTCSLTRGVYLDLLPSLETDKFLTSLKRFIARRCRPQVIYSDNGSMFKAAAG